MWQVGEHILTRGELRFAACSDVQVVQARIVQIPKRIPASTTNSIALLQAWAAFVAAMYIGLDQAWQLDI